MGYKYGCKENKDEWIKQAEEVLCEKYGEEFEVLAVGGSYGTIMNNTYSVISRPKSNQDCLFEAEIHKNKLFVSDTYISALMANKIKMAFESEISEFSPEFFIHVGYMNRFTESNDASISLEQYVSMSHMNKFNVYMAFEDSIADVSKERLTSAINTAMEKQAAFSGSVKISILEKEDIKWLKTYMKLRAYADARFFDIFNQGSLDKYSISNGNIVGEE